jgi:hypothetical protein
MPKAYVQLSLRMDPASCDRLRQAADHAGKSLNGWAMDTLRRLAEPQEPRLATEVSPEDLRRLPRYRPFGRRR